MYGAQPDTVVITVETKNTDGSTTTLTTEPLDGRDITLNSTNSRFRMRVDLDGPPQDEFDDFSYASRGRWSRHSVFAPDHESFKLDVRLRPKSSNKNAWVYRVVHKEAPSNRVVMKAAISGVVELTSYTEEEAQRYVHNYPGINLFFLEVS